MSSVARSRPEGQPGKRKLVRPSRGTCRLTLSINGTAYTVRPIEADPSAALQAFRLRKPDGTAYHIARHIHGNECDCPDFIFHRDGLDPAGCKHIKALIACGVITSTPEVTPESADEKWTDSGLWTIA